MFRFQKAKLNVLTKQIQEEKLSKNKLTEQINDLHKQLKQEKDENKGLKKRFK
jgi:hypothetical protein